MNSRVCELRVNVGCGATPTPGWINFDNSWSVRLARFPTVAKILGIAHLIDPAQLRFIEKARHAGVKWANAVSRIPLKSGSVEVIYSSHMIEHLDPHEAKGFLREAYRCLCPGGIIRLAVPDLEKMVNQYLETRNADDFIRRTLLAFDPPKTVCGRVKLAVVGYRHHLWMYDGMSLQRSLSNLGYEQARVMAAGQTQIATPGALDLFERADESVYVEAVRGVSDAGLGERECVA